MNQCPLDEITGEGTQSRGRPCGVWETGGETAGGSPSLSPAQVCPSLPPHPPPSPPLAPHLPLLSCPLAQCTVLSRPPDLPHFMKPCPLLSLQHCWPQGDRERAPRPTQTCTRAHTRHTVDTPRHKYTGLRLQGPRGGCVVSLAFRAQPAPETALGQASPGQAGAKRLGLPSSGPRSRAGEGAASLHSRHCLKENGGPCPPGGPLEGSACLPVWLSGPPPLL